MEFRGGFERRSCMARASLVFLLLVPACFRGAPPPPTVANEAPAPKRATSSLSGDYSAPHTIRMVCDGGQPQDPDGWCEENVEDTMTIRERVNGSIDVAIELVGTNAHTCSFEGTLERTVDGEASARRWRFQSDDEESPCSLVIEHAAKLVTIRAEGCREYCGVRASLDAAFDFPPSRSPRG